MLLPVLFSATPPDALLRAASLGRIGMDQRVIRALLERPEQTLDALGALAFAEDESRLVDMREPFFDLYRALGSPRAVPYYIRLLRENPSEIPDELVEAFAAQGDAALEAILACHAEMDPDTAPDIAFLLAAMGARDERVRAILRGVLAADPYEGALSIGLLGDPALKPDVEAALAALPAAASAERKALEDCLEMLAAPSPREPEPFDIFSLYPASAPPLFEALPDEDILPYLACGSAEYRAAAARAFAGIQDYPDPVRDALLERARTDESLEVRAESLRALGPHAGDASIRPFLLETALSAQAPAELRAAALIALAPPAGDADLQPVLLAFYENEATRAAALEAMWRSLDARYQKYFAANLRHEDDEIAAQAIQAVGALPLPALALELVPLFNHPALREDALVSYALSVNAPITPKSVSKLFDRIEEKAGGMTEGESESVALALDHRLELEGFRPVFFPDGEEDDDSAHAHSAPASAPGPARSAKVGRNDPCPCGSGKKYKKCHGA
jgi:hypothetical protein